MDENTFLSIVVICLTVLGIADEYFAYRKEALKPKRGRPRKHKRSRRGPTRAELGKNKIIFYYPDGVKETFFL